MSSMSAQPGVHTDPASKPKKGWRIAQLVEYLGSIHEALASTSITKENGAKVPAHHPNTQETEVGDQKFKAIPGYTASFELKKEKKHNLEVLQIK